MKVGHSQFVDIVTRNIVFCKVPIIVLLIVDKRSLDFFILEFSFCPAFMSLQKNPVFLVSADKIQINVKMRNSLSKNCAVI